MKTPFIYLIILAFVLNTLGPIPTAKAEPIYSAEGELHLPAPGILVHLSPPENPPVLKGVTVYPNNPFKFDFILDRGNRHPERSEGSQQEQLKTESAKLVKYFLASITTPENDLWVNLSPYEKNRIITESFGQNAMGRDLLAEDYILKQITASLIYPEAEIGRQFWKRIYEEASKKFGTTNIPVNTFNKVWIIPDHAKVYEHGNTAFVVKARLKVMLEEDYLALSKNTKTSTHSIASKIIREIVIPQLEKEVNEGKNFATLRQVYYSLILAVWFKKRMKDSILGRKYMDQNKISNLLSSNTGPTLSSPNALVGDPQHIYQQYLKAFKKGVYNYIKEEPDPATQEMIPRKYFSGGFVGNFAMNAIDYSRKITPDEAAVPEVAEVVVDLASAAPSDLDFPKIAGNLAMTGVSNEEFSQASSEVKDIAETRWPGVMLQKVRSLVALKKASQLGPKVFKQFMVLMRNPRMFETPLAREAEITRSFPGYETVQLNLGGNRKIAYALKRGKEEFVVRVYRYDPENAAISTLLNDSEADTVAKINDNRLTAEIEKVNGHLALDRLEYVVPLDLVLNRVNKGGDIGLSNELTKEWEGSPFLSGFGDGDVGFVVRRDADGPFAYLVAFDMEGHSHEIVNAHPVRFDLNRLSPYIEEVIPDDPGLIKAAGPFHDNRAMNSVGFKKTSLPFAKWVQNLSHQRLSLLDKMQVQSLNGMIKTTRLDKMDRIRRLLIQAAAKSSNGITGKKRLENIFSREIFFLTTVNVKIPVPNVKQARGVVAWRSYLLESKDGSEAWKRLAEMYHQLSIETGEPYFDTFPEKLNKMLVENDYRYLAPRSAATLLDRIRLHHFDPQASLPYSLMSLRPDLSYYREYSENGNMVAKVIFFTRSRYTVIDTTEFYFVNGEYAGYGHAQLPYHDRESLMVNKFDRLQLLYHIFEKHRNMGLSGKIFEERMKELAVLLPEDGQFEISNDQFNKEPSAIRLYTNATLGFKPKDPEFDEALKDYKLLGRIDQGRFLEIIKEEKFKGLFRSTLVKPVKDEATLTKQAPGGIDLTAKRMKLEVDSDKAAVSQPMDLKMLENIEINGLYIKDIEVKPLKNLPELLGVPAA